MWIWSLFIAFCLGLGFWVAVVWLGGCGNSLTEVTGSTTTTVPSGSTLTTTPGNTTTTTVGQPGPISGTVSWTPSFASGTLFVFLWTGEDFDNRDLISDYRRITLSSGQTSADYLFSSPGGPLKGVAPSPRKYYVFALLYAGRSAQLFDDPEAGDKIGQFSNGEFPISFGGSTHAAPLDYTSAAQPGKDFSLNAAWTTPTSSTTTTTLPPGASWQDIGGVRLSGSAEGAFIHTLVSDSSGNIYAGGRFDSAGGVPVNNIAKWNHSTSSWESLAGGVDGFVGALAVDSGNLYVGGSFTTATNSGGSVTVNKIAKWNGTSWSPLGSGFIGGGDQILSMAVDGSGNVYAGGNFDHAGGVPTDNVAEWKTASSTWDAMAGGLSLSLGGTKYSCQVFAMAIGSGSNIYFAGTFNTSESIPIDGIAKWNLSSPSWESIGSGGNAIAADNSGNIYTAGGKWNGSAWQSLTDSDPGRPPVLSLAAKSSSQVFSGAINYSYIGKLNGTVWNNLAGGLVNVFGNIEVQALALDPAGDLYVGGKFTSAGGVPAANIVKRINP
jgi:hypothetical protein